MSTHKQLDAIVIDAKDNVATALRQLKADQQALIGTPSGIVTCDVRETIPLCHKLAFTRLTAGNEIIKYGAVIGRLTADTPAGGHIHIHNLQSRRAQR